MGQFKKFSAFLLSFLLIASPLFAFESPRFAQLAGWSQQIEFDEAWSGKVSELLDWMMQLPEFKRLEKEKPTRAAHMIRVIEYYQAFADEDGIDTNYFVKNLQNRDDYSEKEIAQYRRGLEIFREVIFDSFSEPQKIALGYAISMHDLGLIKSEDFGHEAAGAEIAEIVLTRSGINDPKFIQAVKNIIINHSDIGQVTLGERSVRELLKDDFVNVLFQVLIHNVADVAGVAPDNIFSPTFLNARFEMLYSLYQGKDSQKDFLKNTLDRLDPYFDDYIREEFIESFKKEEFEALGISPLAVYRIFALFDYKDMREKGDFSEIQKLGMLASAIGDEFGDELNLIDETFSNGLHFLGRSYEFTRILSLLEPKDYRYFAKSLKVWIYLAKTVMDEKGMDHLTLVGDINIFSRSVQRKAGQIADLEALIFLDFLNQLEQNMRQYFNKKIVKFEDVKVYLKPLLNQQEIDFFGLKVTPQYKDHILNLHFIPVYENYSQVKKVESFKESPHLKEQFIAVKKGLETYYLEQASLVPSSLPVNTSRFHQSA